MIKTREILFEDAQPTKIKKNHFVKPYLCIEQNDSLGGKGNFAYELEVVKKPRTDDEEREFQQYAERWHREFFRMLALLIDDKVSLTIKYCCRPSDSNEKSD